MWAKKAGFGECAGKAEAREKFSLMQNARTICLRRLKVNNYFHFINTIENRG
jgi:hypothetical protein